MNAINLESIYGVLTVLFMAWLIYSAVTSEADDTTYTVYMDKDSYWAIKAYRLAREEYHSTIFPKTSKFRVLKDLQAKVPKQYYYLLDDSRYDVAIAKDDLD